MALELKVPPLVQVMLVGVAMIVGSRFLPHYNLGMVFSVGLVSLLVIAGVCFSVLGVIEFRRNKTTVDPRFPDRTSSLVTTGVYSVSRNPMYVGFAILLCALPVYFESPFLVVGVILFVFYMNGFQILPEERILEKHFGAEFFEYKSKVRRWL